MKWKRVQHFSLAAILGNWFCWKVESFFVCLFFHFLLLSDGSPWTMGINRWCRSENMRLFQWELKIGIQVAKVSRLKYWDCVSWLVNTVECATNAKSLQSCPTLCDPIDGSPPGSPVPGILQARTLEWVAISFSNAWKWKVKVKSLSRVRLPAIPWTTAHQAPPSKGFSRQEYRSGVPLPSPEKRIVTF